jgi:thiol:disulfide interchange protein DsbD
MKKEWQAFGLKIAAWLAAAGVIHFLTSTLLGRAPDYLVPGILVLGALHIGLLDRTPLPGGDGKMLKRGLGLLMVTLAFWIANGSGAPSKIPWQVYSDELLAVARQTGRPVMIDFTSRNCPPCAAMERKVFNHHRVEAAARNFLALRADLTDEKSKPAQALMARYEITGYPTLVFLDAEGKERRNLRLVGFENATFFAERVESAR